MELFALYFDILLFYIDPSIGFWITWILKKENPKIELFPPLADLALNNIYIYIYEIHSRSFKHHRVNSIVEYFCYIPSMNLSHVWFLYISPFSLYLTPTHTLLLQNVSLCKEKDEESRSIPSGSEGACRRTGSFWAPALKTNCNKVLVCHKSVEIGLGRLDYLLRSASTDRERFVTSEKVR